MYCDSAQKMPQPMGAHGEEILMEINASEENGNRKNKEGRHDQTHVFSFGFYQIPANGNENGRCSDYIPKRDSQS